MDGSHSQIQACLSPGTHSDGDEAAEPARGASAMVPDEAESKWGEEGGAFLSSLPVL